jgi:hypothetical protein
MDVRLGTFNLNNLFDRFNFEADLGTLPAADRNVHTTYQWVFVGQGTEPQDPPPQLDLPTSSTPIVRIQRGVRGELIQGKPAAAQQALAARIAAVDADVLALQEVENLDALRRFNRDLLAQPYAYEVLVEGNDPRFIDVAVLSRLPIANVTTHRFEVHPDDPMTPVFGRDLLELQVFNQTRGRKLLTLFVTHLKSKFVPFDDPDPVTTALATTACSPGRPRPSPASSPPATGRTPAISSWGTSTTAPRPTRWLRWCPAWAWSTPSATWSRAVRRHRPPPRTHRPPCAGPIVTRSPTPPTRSSCSTRSG